MGPTFITRQLLFAIRVFARDPDTRSSSRKRLGPDPYKMLGKVQAIALMHCRGALAIPGACMARDSYAARETG